MAGCQMQIMNNSGDILWIPVYNFREMLSPLPRLKVRDYSLTNTTMTDEKLRAEQEADKAREEKAEHSEGVANASEKEAKAEQQKADIDKKISQED